MDFFGHPNPPACIDYPPLIQLHELYYPIHGRQAGEHGASERETNGASLTMDDVVCRKALNRGYPKSINNDILLIQIRSTHG